MKMEDVNLLQNIITVLSAFITATATIVAVLITIWNQEKQRKNDDKKKALPLIKIDNLSNLEKSSNYNELSIKSKTDITEEKRTPLHANRLLWIPIKNVGYREAYNVRVYSCDSDHFMETDVQEITPIIYKDGISWIVINIVTYLPKTVDANLSFEDTYVHCSAKLPFKILFDDCFGNSYQQKFAIDVTFDYIKLSGGDDAGMYKDFENTRWCGDYEVLSAPEEVNNNKNRQN